MLTVAPYLAENANPLSIHAGMVVVADGSADAGRRLERVLTIDPGSGIMRHADAGYDEAVDAARRPGLKLPGITWSPRI